MTVDFCMLNQVVSLIAATVYVVVSLLEQINTFPGILVLVWYMLFLYTCE